MAGSGTDITVIAANGYKLRLIAGTGTAQVSWAQDSHDSSGRVVEISYVRASIYKTFRGWYENGSLYTTMDMPTIEITRNITLTAICMTRSTYTHKIKSSDTSRGTASDTQTVTFWDGSYGSGSDAVATAVAKDGYVFTGLTGWSGDTSQAVFSGSNNETCTISRSTAGNVTVTANFVKECSVVFDSSGGSSVQPQTVIEGSSIQSSPSTTRTGYSFDGWYDSEYGGSQYSFPLTVTSDMYIYAHWTANTYTIALDRQSGTGGSSTVTAKYGQELPVVSCPERHGYEFGGYYTDVNGNGEEYYTRYGAPSKIYELTSGITLYAKWIPIQSEVVLKANNNQDLWPHIDPKFPDGSSEKYIVVTYGQNYPTLPSSKIPSSVGYTFKCWYNQDTGDNFPDGAQLNTQTVQLTSSTNFWAQWTARRAR